ncbi:MAG: hypothetical protein M1300_07575 [Epsilonproteobacteria bacterium]|nr:hypothetical protein [Campylobacterota bacterium]
MREKWSETVTYPSDDDKDSINDDKHELYAFNAGNGDLYFGVRKQGAQIGMMVRICRDGGASFKNPRLMGALTEAYDAMAGNEDGPDREKCVWKQSMIDENVWETSCYEHHQFMDGGPKDNNHKFCPYCGKEIAA